MKKRLAIIGSGVSAMTCAYYLGGRYDISVFEKNDYLGGHTHTHTIKEGEREFRIDSGFMVFNLQTYPNMVKMFEELGVEMQKTDMSFSVYNRNADLQYSGSSFMSLFAQRRNLLSLRFWKFLFEINSFFKVALRDHAQIAGSTETIREYCRRNGLSDYFIENYLAPMSSAVWSVPQGSIFDFPISLLLPFFYNHGLLGATGQHQWYTVKGGSDTYIRKIVERTALDIHLNEGATSVSQDEDGVMLKTQQGEYRFDLAILASHSDESMKIYETMPEDKRRLLSHFGYNGNNAVLHTDTSKMPPERGAWASWNQIVDVDGKKGSTVYWMNNLQRPGAEKEYLVSINPFDAIDETRILQRMEYSHPNFTVESFNLQKRLPELNVDTKIFFAGAYFGYGFHEDGVKSGLAVVDILKNNA